MARAVWNRGDGGAVGYYKILAVVLIDAVGVKCLIGIVWFVVPLLFSSCCGQWKGQLTRCC